MKFQISSTKSQTVSKLEMPMTKNYSVVARFIGLNQSLRFVIARLASSAEAISAGLLLMEIAAPRQVGARNDKAAKGGVRDE
jgi:hypothetical protein